MTKLLKKVFICGILLSSVSAYCNESGVGVDVYPQLSDGKLTLSESSFTIGTNAILHNDIVIGSLDEDRLSLSGNKITANEFQIAKTDDGKVWRAYDDGNSGLNIIPVGGDNAVYKFYGASNQYVCLSSDTTDAESKLYEQYENKWYVNTGDDLNTAGTQEVKVIDLGTETNYKLATGANPSLLFDGTLATKGDDGKWYKGTDTESSNKEALPKVTLSVIANNTLTIGNKQESIKEATISKLNDSDVADGDPTTLDYSKNTSGATITFTEFSNIESGSSIVLLDANTQNYEKVDVGGGTTKTTDINNPILETKAVFEPGSEAGDGTTITNGTTDLGKYLEVKTDGDGKQSLEAKSTEGAFLNLALNGKVDVFSAIIPSDATGDAKSKTIDLFNTSNVPQVFPNVTNKSGAKISIDVPYTYNIEDGNAYNSINDLADNIQADNKVSINLASKNKLAGLFKDGADINYTMNSKDTTDTETLSKLVDETIAYTHDISKSNADEETKNVYLDVSSLKKFDKDFNSDEYFYDGQEGQKKLNVIPIDGDAYIIPYDNKLQAGADPVNTTIFNLKASTDKTSDVIKKYIEPNMTDVVIKASDGTALITPPTTITYSTELSKVGASDSKKVLLLNSENNNLTERTVLLDENYLNVKSKDGAEIKMSTLKLNNGSNINIYGTNNVQNLVVNSSKLRIRGKFIWGA